MSSCAPLPCSSTPFTHGNQNGSSSLDVYTPDILRCRKSGVLTGLPDAYGRGRIIGDYRRVALYGIDYLMKDKLAQFTSLQADLENVPPLAR